jgi:hypothetical protein
MFQTGDPMAETRFKFWRKIYPALLGAIRALEGEESPTKLIHAVRVIMSDAELGRMSREQFYDKKFYDVMTEIAEEQGKKKQAPGFEHRLKVIRDVAGLVFNHDPYYLEVFRELANRYAAEEGG